MMVNTSNVRTRWPSRIPFVESSIAVHKQTYRSIVFYARSWLHETSSVTTLNTSRVGNNSQQTSLKYF